MSVWIRRPTIKNLKDTLETMRKVYDYKDDKTIFYNNFSGEKVLHISTTDEETGVNIEMSKSLLDAEEENEE